MRFRKDILTEIQKQMGTVHYDTNEKIMVLHIEDLVDGIVVLDNLVAKSLQRDLKYDVIAVNYGQRDISKIDEAFGFKSISLGRVRNKKYSIMTAIKALYYFILYGTGEKVVSMRYKQIKNIGNLIYDQYLIQMKVPTLKKRMKFITGFSMFYDVFTSIKFGKKFFKKNNIKYCVVSELTYIRSVLAHMAESKNANLVISHFNFRNYIPTLYNNDKASNKLSTFHTYELMLKRAYQKYKNTKGKKIEDSVDFAFSYIKQLSMEQKGELIRKMKLDSSKKTVVILPHCFRDTPRSVSSGKIIFRDYYEWLIYTLEIAEHVHNVNWLIKQHPLGSLPLYEQDKLIEKIVHNYKNVHLVPLEYSEYSVDQYADIILTCVGDAGVEYAARGLCTITAGKNVYNDYGISIRANSKEEYKFILTHMPYINVDEKMERKAKRYLAIWKYSRAVDEGEDLAMLYKILWEKLSVEKKRSSLENINRWYQMEFFELLRKQKVTNSQIFINDYR